MQKLRESLSSLALVAIAITLGVIAWQTVASRQPPELTTPFQAVALINGQVFFGRLEAGGGDYYALRDVFYLQTRQNPETRQAANVLVKRGGEAHGPDRMILDRRQVLLIEPVTEKSQIGVLIAEQLKKL